MKPTTRPQWVKSVAPYLTSVAILLVAVAWGANASPYFLDVGFLSVNTGRYAEIGLLALGLTFVMINGDIDLSVAANMAVSAAILGIAFNAGVPIQLSVVLAVATGTLLGAFNGVVITALRVPSLVVTLGTLALYRGIAQILLRDSAITDYPASFVGADQVGFFGTSPDLYIPLAVLLVASVAGWFLLERTTFGLSSFLTGSNSAAARFSGIAVVRTRFLALSLSGMMAGAAAVLITSRLGSTRSNLASGWELAAITVVVLGGTVIEGGRGSIQGTVLALAAFMAVREALTIDNVNGQTQDAVMGLILILSILVPRALSKTRERRLRRGHAQDDGRLTNVSVRTDLSEPEVSVRTDLSEPEVSVRTDLTELEGGIE